MRRRWETSATLISMCFDRRGSNSDLLHQLWSFYRRMARWWNPSSSFCCLEREMLADCGQSCQTLVQRRELGLVSLPA